MEKLLFEKETYKIRGACFDVYNVLGGGIPEKIIQRALFNELTTAGFVVNKERKIDVFYKQQKVGVYIPDMVVNNKIIIEVKSKPQITKEDLKQFWGYLKGSGYLLGFLVAFTPQELIIKRFVYTRNPYKSV
ncbi:MAG: GxxExxY protein [bacterium]